MEIEHHHLANTVEIIIGGSNHPWMLKLLDGNMTKKKLSFAFFIPLKYLPWKIWIIYKEKNKFTVENPGTHHLNYTLRVTFNQCEDLRYDALLL